MILRRRFLAAAGTVASLAGVAGIGGLAWWKRRRRPRETPFAGYSGPSARLAELPDNFLFELCIVGSGPAGVVLGTEMAKAGVRTIILEAGVGAGDPLAGRVFEVLNQPQVTGDPIYPLPGTRFIGPGGTTMIWTGNCPRQLPVDYEVHAYTPPGAAWPVDYQTMEPFYAMAERTLRVRGDTEAARKWMPRSGSLPIEQNGGNDAIKGLLASVGVASINTFKSTSPSGGPIRVARDLLPQFVALQPATLVTGATVRRFVCNDGEKVSGALVRDFQGLERVIRARAFVLAAGAVESARRLLLSRSDRRPKGLGNDFDVVGRGFNDHYHYQFTARIPPLRTHGNNGSEAVRSYQFYEAFRRAGFGALTLVADLQRSDPRWAKLGLKAALEMYPSSSNRVTLIEDAPDAHGDPRTALQLTFQPEDFASMARAKSLIRDLYSRLRATEIKEESTQWAHHHMGTTRMGNDPHASVVDANLRVHGCANLYVVSSGNFVTCGPTNATLLIVALSHRLAGHLRERFDEGAFL